jgi:hypothetical protein
MSYLLDTNIHNTKDFQNIPGPYASWSLSY